MIVFKHKLEKKEEWQLRGHKEDKNNDLMAVGREAVRIAVLARYLQSMRQNEATEQEYVKLSIGASVEGLGLAWAKYKKIEKKDQPNGTY